MTNPTPLTHLEEAQKLTADAIISVFELTLKGAPTTTVVNFKDGYSGIWQGKTYEGLSCKLAGVTRSTTGQAARPTLIVANPAGVFNSFAFAGYFEGSQLIQRRILRAHFEGDINISDLRYWVISRVYGMMAGQSISFELRGQADGPTQMIPARQYIPDDGFPFVTL